MADPSTSSPEPVGRVIGTDDATPLEFWVGVADDQFLQLDDVVALDRTLPDGQRVAHLRHGRAGPGPPRGRPVRQRRLPHRGRPAAGEVSEAAKVITTRVEPEVFVPPLPGTAVRKATGDERDGPCTSTTWPRSVPAGLSRDGEPFFLDLEFLDGSRGAHVNISGVSGVATKTTYATFLLYSLFTPECSGPPPPTPRR
jgi:uncharacterized protein